MHHERLSVYNSTNEMLPPSIEKKIQKICTDQITQHYLKSKTVAGNVLFQCAKLSAFGTEYKVNQYVLLPDSSNSCPSFGKITKLLCSKKSAYLMCQKTSNTFCPLTDLFMITEKNEHDIIQVDHLADYHPLQGNVLF